MKKFLESPLGRGATVALLLIGIGAAGWSVWSSLSSDSAVTAGNNPLFINAETGYAFHFKVYNGAPYPVPCPDTGKATGYEAELCFWTKDGHAKSEPTPVLLNKYKGLPEPTFCPDCGRLVHFHNQLAIEGNRPPPTKAEYMASHGNPTP